MNLRVIDFVKKTLSENKRVALVTLSESGGHTPGKPGALMAVDERGVSVGTIGGGAVEHDVIHRCVEAMVSGNGFSFSYDLSEIGGTGMVCGGNCAGFAHILGAMPRLIVFGGGHCGEKIAQVAGAAGFDVTVVDERNRADFFGGCAYVQKLPDDAVRELRLDESCYVVIVTHGHVQDYAALSAVIDSDAAYIGMIGSEKKVSRTFGKMRELGVAEELIGRVYAPIGLDIADGSPGEIAIAIMAEILAVKNGKRPVHMRGPAS